MTFTDDTLLAAIHSLSEEAAVLWDTVAEEVMDIKDINGDLKYCSIDTGASWPALGVSGQFVIQRNGIFVAGWSGHRWHVRGLGEGWGRLDQWALEFKKDTNGRSTESFPK